MGRGFSADLRQMATAKEVRRLGFHHAARGAAVSGGLLYTTGTGDKQYRAQCCFAVWLPFPIAAGDASSIFMKIPRRAARRPKLSRANMISRGGASMI